MKQRAETDKPALARLSSWRKLQFINTYLKTNVFS